MSTPRLDGSWESRGKPRAPGQPSGTGGLQGNSAAFLLYAGTANSRVVSLWSWRRAARSLPDGDGVQPQHVR